MNPQQFFHDFFPNTYICAMMQGGGQFEGRLVTIETNLKELLSIYGALNAARYNIYFTPNGGKSVEGRNSLSNLAQINSWWIDIDIDAAKNANDEETLIYRENRKSEILGEIFGRSLTDLWPSLTIETRNGYQLYWFCKQGEAKAENWMSIGNSIYEHYKMVGADKSTVKVMQLMRVPNFCYIKNGEVGKISVFAPLSSLQRYSEEQMITAFPPQPVRVDPIDFVIKPRTWKPKYKTNLDDSDDIFIKAVNAPIDFAIQKLSKHWLVDGDELTFHRVDTDKSNILVNGKMSPNFVVRSKNHIYSNNANIKGPTIIQYLKWYKWTDAEIAKGLKEIFTK